MANTNKSPNGAKYVAGSQITKTVYDRSERPPMTDKPTEREFVAHHLGSSVDFSPESSRLLEHPAYREGVLREIQQNPGWDASGLLRDILQREVAERAKDADNAYLENLYWCAFLLYRIGDVRDVTSLWRAKNTDFDSASCLDCQALVGAGVDATIRYLQEKEDHESKDALEYIKGCKSSGEFDSLDDWAKWRSDYYGAAPESP
jgi:hypothetical protein